MLGDHEAQEGQGQDGLLKRGVHNPRSTPDYLVQLAVIRITGLDEGLVTQMFEHDKKGVLCAGHRRQHVVDVPGQ